MIKKERYEKIQEHLNQENYNDLALLLEKYIEKEPQEFDYYWYLGLVYLLQENEEIAQEIWFSPLLCSDREEAKKRSNQLIKFMEAQVENYLDSQKLGNATITYETITIIDPNYQNIQIRNNLVTSLSLFASNLSFNQEYQSAVEVYQVALSLDDEHAISYHALGLTYYYLEEYSNAQKTIAKAIKLDANNAENYHVLGMILEKQAKYNQAIASYEKAICKDSKLLSSYCSLIDLYTQQYLNLKLLEISSKIVTNFPRNSSLSQKLGDAYEFLGDSSHANFHWGYSAYYSGGNNSLSIALEHFEKYYQVHADEVKNDFNFYGVMANCYAMCNKTNSAIALLEKALTLFPERRFEIKRLSQCQLPIIYTTVEEIDFYRQRFSNLLTQLVSETSYKTHEERIDLLNSVRTKSNFYLGYQGQNDLEIQKKYSIHVYSIMQKAWVQFSQENKLQALQKKQKIRIGIASHRLEGLGRLYLGWIKYLNRKKFEVYTYNLIAQEEISLHGLKYEFKDYSDQFTSLDFTTDWQKNCNTIISDQLDILIFPDFGIDALLNMLAYLRLAPIQCTTWGHPITSGSPSIDYFFSSDLMEPENGQEHYSEELIRLPNLAFSLPSVNLPLLDKSREDFQLKASDIVYLCSQSLFKYLPQHDYIFASIAQKSTSFRFVFLDPVHGEIITECFKVRLEKIFSEVGLDYQEYCIFLPRLSNIDFIKLNLLSDIFLDCLSWSGGLTTHQAIACGLPIVTCPGELMRSRHTYAMLKMIEVTETIAQTEAEYIDLAIRLGMDYEWRKIIKAKMIANKELLFEDKECVIGLEKFFEQAINKYNQRMIQ